MKVRQDRKEPVWFKDLKEKSFVESPRGNTFYQGLREHNNKMAASGIAEHHEARRRETVYLRKAFLEKERRAGFESVMGPQGASSGEASARNRMDNNAPNTYDYELQRQQNLGRTGTGIDAASVDKERRLAHLAQQQREYTAKIPNRYSSNDYISQW